MATKPNARRIALAVKALTELSGEPSHIVRTTPEPLVDALTDLRHFAERYNIDFYRALETSYEHYLVERGDEEV